MKRVWLCCVAFLFLLTSVFSQESKDAGLWATVSMEKKVGKKFFLFITEEYRRRENFTRLNLFYTDIGFGIKPYDFLKVSLAYRPIQKYQDNNTFSFRHRLMLDITLKKKYRQFIISFRERLQAENRNIYSSPKGHLLEWYSRNKFKFGYDINKPITPYVAIEFRYQINNPRAKESNKMWSRNRYFAGLDYKRNDRHSFGLYYMIQQEWNVSAPQDLFILGIEYSLSL